MLPPAPSVFKSRGAVMFVDVSGFTLLGEELRAAHGPVQGGAMLAERITSVISQLATLCLDHGGDVSKFAGDALLCVWEGGPEENMLADAQECAVAMLRMMKQSTDTTASRLQIHGGLGKSSPLALCLVHLKLTPPPNISARLDFALSSGQRG
jgi:class 3 adenylate cyclase